MHKFCNGEQQEHTVAQPAIGLLPSSYRKSAILFCLATFFFWASLYLFVPVLPVYAQTLGASLSMVGVVIASYALPQIITRIPMGVWFDTLDRRKPMVAAGIIIAALGALGLGLAPTTWFLALARAITGIGASCWVIFTVYFASYYPGERMGRAIGLINFVNSAAVVTATSCGGIAADVWGFSPIFFIAATLGIISLAALLAAKEPERKQLQSVSLSWKGFRQAATHPLLLTVSGMGIVNHYASYAGIFGFIPIYASDIGASKTELGLLTMITIASAGVASLFASHLAERHGSRFVVILGAALLGGALLAVPFLNKVYMLEMVQVFNGLGWGTLNTILMILAIRAVAPQQRATAMGVYQAIYAIGMMLGPLLSGFLADNLSLSLAFYLAAFLCVIVAAMAFLPVLAKR
ncbi:MFS transporter [Chloroflexota bacterium]